jgi:hypothetical protein
MSIAAEANHMVAAMGLLRWSSTCRAWRGISLEILQRGLFFICELSSGKSRCANVGRTMPALVAAATESKFAVFADTEKVFARLKFLLIGRRTFLVFCLVIAALDRTKIMAWLSMLLGSGSTLTPLSRAVDRVLV